jgi:surface protein
LAALILTSFSSGNHKHSCCTMEQQQQQQQQPENSPSDCGPDGDTTCPLRLDRTFSDDAAMAPLNEVVSLVLLENEKDPWRQVPKAQPRSTLEDEPHQRSPGMPWNVSPPLPLTKDPLTGTLHSQVSDSTAGTRIIPVPVAPGSYAVSGISVHSSENNSEISGDEESYQPLEHQKGTIDNDSLAPIDTVVTTAKLVTSATLDESERQRIYRQAVKTVTSNAVVAHIVQTEKSSERPYHSPSSSVPTSFNKRTQRSSLLYCLASCLFVIGILLGVSVPYVMNRTAREPLVVEPPINPPPPSTAVQQPAATLPAVPSTTTNSTTDPLACVYHGIGCKAFETTDELYQAVDAMDNATSYYASHPENLTITSEPTPVTIRYGYLLGRWNVSLLTNFSRVFDPWRHLPFNPDRALQEGRENQSTTAPSGLAIWFNEDLSGWDVSNAVTMFGMFAGAASFQGRGLENWDTSRVVNLSYAFMDATSFNGQISRWNTKSAITMEGMFQGVRAFDGDVSMWNVSQVTNMDSMFYGNYAFRGEYLHRWDVSNVYSMHSMFQDAYAFNGNISTWNTSRVETMANMVRSNSW